MGLSHGLDLEIHLIVLVFISFQETLIRIVDYLEIYLFGFYQILPEFLADHCYCDFCLLICLDLWYKLVRIPLTTPIELHNN